MFFFCFCVEEGSFSLGCESVFYECDYLYWKFIVCIVFFCFCLCWFSFEFVWFFICYWIVFFCFEFVNKVFRCYLIVENYIELNSMLRFRFLCLWFVDEVLMLNCKDVFYFFCVIVKIVYLCLWNIEICYSRGNIGL